MSLIVKEVNQSGSTSAPSIVFLHGLGVSSWMWQAQVEELSRDYRCITIDLPGNGESYQSPWNSFADAAEQVAVIIQQQATNGKAHVVGLSLGGYVALHLLAQRPEVTESTIVSGVTSRPFRRQWLWRLTVGMMAPLLHWKPLLKMNAKAMQFPAEVIPLFIRDTQRLSKSTFRRVYDQLLNYSLPEALKGQPHRLLAVAGDAEAQMIRDGLAGFAQSMPNAKAALAPNAHHGWNGEHPQLFNEMIRAWVESRSLPAALKRVEV